MENVRYNISPCSKIEVDEFIAKIDTEKFKPNGTVRSTERSHYDRYSFLQGDSRIAVVYDTTANIVSITARADHAKLLLDLFAPKNKAVKQSAVPAHGTAPAVKTVTPISQTAQLAATVANGDGKRAKLFVPTDRLKRRAEYVPVPTVLATSKGMIVTTDEIYPPQTVRKRERAPKNATESNTHTESQIQKRPLPSYGEATVLTREADRTPQRVAAARQTEHANDNVKPCGIAISVGGREKSETSAAPRRAVISFGSDDESDKRGGEFKINTRSQTFVSSGEAHEQKRKRGRPRKAESVVKPDNSDSSNATEQAAPEQKRKRGRPKKSESVIQEPRIPTPEYKNGYSVKNYPFDALGGAIKRLRADGKTVISDGTDFGGTPQEVKAYTVTDSDGQKVLLRYATKRMTLQLQGKRSELFGEVMSQVSYDSDYSSALENYVEKTDGQGGKVSDVQKKLKKRLPTAYEYLSEQSRIDFSYGIHDFDQQGLVLSDYSVLLVPAFRGLERFVFDLQAAENIRVKMIGQAFDKDDNGRYVLKSGYCQRINSVIYPEVLVALYTEYFMQRNFFAHTDNTGGNVSRSIHDKSEAKKIFDRLLDAVEYNSKKLKEIGFSISK